MTAPHLPEQNVRLVELTDSRPTDGVLKEARAIWDLIEAHAAEPAADKPKTWQGEWWYRVTLGLVASVFVFAGLGLITVQLWPFIVAVTALIGIPVPFIIASVLLMRRDWQRRRIESVANARKLAERYELLLEQLLPFSRAALGKVADDLTILELRVDRRVATILGQGRGGLLALAAVAVAGVTAIGKLFESNAVDPGLHSWIWNVFFMVMALALAALFGRHSVNAVGEYSSVLRQAATLRETTEKEDKEQRERLKE